MNINDVNFRIVEAFNPVISSEKDYFWKLGDQLEDMPCLFKIARIFSYFLECLYLDGWYLDQIKTVYTTSVYCLQEKADNEVTIPILRTELTTIKNNQYHSGITILDFRHIKKIIDFQQKMNEEANQLLNAGIDRDVVDAGIIAFSLLGYRDRRTSNLKTTVAPKEIERIQNVLISEGNIPQAVAKACQAVSYPSTSVLDLEKEIRRKLQAS